MTLEETFNIRSGSCSFDRFFSTDGTRTNFHFIVDYSQKATYLIKKSQFPHKLHFDCCYLLLLSATSSKNLTNQIAKMGVGGLLLRLSSTLLHGITLLTTVFVLAVYAYFIDKLRHDSLPIDSKWEAVLGISAAAALWSMLALTFTLCLGGVKILAWVGMVLDILFAGATVAIIVHTDNGRHSCSNGAFADTPVGSGTVGNLINGNQAVLDGKQTISLKTACDLQKAAFSVAIATS